MTSNIIAEIQISYSSQIPKNQRLKINRSQDAKEIFLNHWDKNLIELQEEFKILLLNNSSEVLGIFNLARGSVRGVVVDIRLLYSVALKTNATALIIAHNHPSGSLEASGQDKDITSQIKKIGELLDIKLLDHIILSKEGYYSFSDQGILN